MVALFLKQSERDADFPQVDSALSRDQLILKSDTSRIFPPSTDPAGYEMLATASYRLLMFHWALYSFVVGNSFSGCILAFMNVRLYDTAVDTISELEVALQDKTFTAGTLRDSHMAAMIRVSVLKKARTSSLSGVASASSCARYAFTYSQ